MKFAKRMERMQASEIRELLKLTAQPDIISFAGGLPAPELFPVEEIQPLLDLLGLLFPFLIRKHLETICIDILLHHKNCLFVFAEEGFEGCRNDYSALVIYLDAIFSDKFYHTLQYIP